MPLTLADLTSRTGLDVLDHLEREAAIPVTGRLQAQGDLIVIPFAWLDGQVELWPDPRWQPVPAAGLVLLRSAAGGNPHTLVAGPGRCEWTTAWLTTPAWTWACSPPPASPTCCTPSTAARASPPAPT